MSASPSVRFPSYRGSAEYTFNKINVYVLMCSETPL